MRKRLALFVAGVVVLAIVAFAVVRIVTRRQASSGRRPNVPVVRVEAPSRDTVRRTIRYTGDVVPSQQANIVAKVSGTLDQIPVNIGARVSQGQLLAEIDATELAQQVELAGATFSTARSDYERARELLDRKLTSAQDFEKAEAQMKVARANHDAATTRLSYARITAPFSGIITRRFLDPGAVAIANSSTLFTLMDFDSVRVSINLLEKDVPVLTVGAPARVSADAFPNEFRAGRVGRLSQAVDPATRTMPAEVFVANQDLRLKPGMYVTVSLTLAEHPDAVTVPAQAVLNDTAGPCVYITADGKARRVPVTTGIEQGGRIEVVSGLAGTESVITAGQQFARDGSPVSVQAGGD